MISCSVVAAISIGAAVGLIVTIVTVPEAETYALRIRPASDTPIDIPITMSPNKTPGTATVSVAVAPLDTDALSRVQETSQVSVNKPRNWSFPLRETTAVAAAIINLLNVKNPPPEGEGKVVSIKKEQPRQT
jgi:hypothetical protein